MTVTWSNHAQGQRNDILRTIARELSFDDAMRWADKFHEAASQLADFPNIGAAVPAECFHVLPPYADQLRQLICKPYRIVYEVAESEIHVVNKGDMRFYIQSAWNIPDSEKREQETFSLRHIGDNFRKVVVTGNPYEKPWTDRNGITFMGIVPFLLDPRSLETL